MKRTKINSMKYSLRRQTTFGMSSPPAPRAKKGPLNKMPRKRKTNSLQKKLNSKKL